jgi:23S rRNA (uracil1939-C5)-methyltransferase
MKRDITIDELAPSGEGVGIADERGERRAIFVPGVARGERVQVEVDFRTRPARAKLLSVLEPSADRVPPPCAFVDRCGGCDWMHLAHETRIAEHGRTIAQLLGVPVTRAWPATQELGYRTRARVHVRAKGRVVAGMMGHRTHEPASVSSCVVLHPALDRARLALEHVLEGARGTGEARLALGAIEEPRRAVVDLIWKGEPLPGATYGRFDVFAGARIFEEGARVPASIGDPTPYVIGADGEPLRLAPGGFSQATESGNQILARRVAELAGDDGPCTELYAGAGNLTVLLARAREVVALESDHDACIAARANLAARGLSARVIEGDAGAFAIPKTTKLVVLDPPREGARAVATALASQRRPPRILYVSCDPPTLARDVKILLAAGFRPSAVETFEMFPQTSHVETIVMLDPPEGHG